MEEDDPVVQEIDVYLTRTLAESLYLFQYPVRPAAADFDDIAHMQARVKPKQQKVELELAVNTYSSNYDSSKGEQIVLNVDGKNTTSDAAFFKSGKMDKLTLTSTKAVTSVSRYAVGLLRSSELHLTPLHAIIQLRPSFSYLDLSDSRAKVDLPSNEPAEEEEDVKAVTVKFAGPQTERAKQAKEKSYRFMQQRMASEAWVATKFHPHKSPLSALESNQLFCSQMDRDVSDLPGTCDEYVKALLPSTLSLDVSADVSQGNQATGPLKSMPLPDQIRTLMCNAKAVEFRQLLEFLPTHCDANLVLRSLQLFAMLVQGCWVVKSEHLFPKDSFSPLTGISADILCRARDYMMWKFTQTRVLRRKDILAAIKIPDEDCKALLMEMSKPCPKGKGCEFIFPYDKEFVVAYPDVVQRQQMLWDAKGQQLKRNLQWTEAKNSLESKPRQRKHRKSARESFSDDTEGSGTDTSQTSGVKMKEKKAARVPVNGAMDVDCQNTGGARFEISPTSLRPTSELKHELLCFVKEKLISRHCLTMSEIRNVLMLTLMESPPGHPLSTGVTDKLLEETVELAGGQQLNNKWPQNTKPEPLFVFTRFGDASDKLRDSLVDLFSKTARIRSTTFQKKVEDELSEIMSEAQTKKILQDYCVIKSGFYYLKGTISPDV